MDAATLNAARRQRVAALIGECSIELSPRDELAGEALRKFVAPATTVFVNHPPSVTHHDIVAACTRLHRAGFDPVPHVAARRLASFTQASDFLHRAAGEAGVERILLIGGDDSPMGPFRASLDLLATGVVERHGIGHVAFGGYPEGHPAIDAHVLDAALQAKVALARAARAWRVAGDAVRLRSRADPALDRGTACAWHRLSGACGDCRPRHCGHAGEVRDPLRYRCIAARAGARAYGIRAYHGGDRSGSADRRTGHRGKRGCTNRGSACVHLRRRAPNGRVDSLGWTKWCVTVLKWLFEATLTLVRVSFPRKGT